MLPPQLEYPIVAGVANALLGTKAAAAVVGVSEETLRRWAAERKIRHVKLPSGQLRFRLDDLKATLEPVEPENVA